RTPCLRLLNRSRKIRSLLHISPLVTMSRMNLRWSGAVLWVGLSIFFLQNGYAEAHATGVSYVATSSPYVVDIGYQPQTPAPSDPLVFDFRLTDEKSQQPVSFDNVWVRIEDDAGTVLATGVAPQALGPTSLLLSTPNAKNLVVHARY